MKRDSKYIITPKSRKCYPISVKKSIGNIVNPNGLLTNDENTTKLIYDKNGEKPRLILDLGPATPGGYPIFKVKSKKGNAVLRIAYSDWMDHLYHEDLSEKGDYVRGSAKYLGVELPVLPSNPNRYELYTINRTGKFIYPLIQGQQRGVMITLDNEDSEVELEYFYIKYTSDMSDYDGCFDCDNEDLTRLWYASTYTVQIASISDCQSWDIIENTLAVRALTKGNPAGIYKTGVEFENYEFVFNAQISINPECASGIGWMVRAKDIDNGYVFRLDLDGTFSSFIMLDGVKSFLKEKIYLEQDILDNEIYEYKTIINGDRIDIYLENTKIETIIDSTFSKGTIGFYQTVEKWALVHNLKVSNNEIVLFSDDFSGNLDDYEFTRSMCFVADGAKRDRLPWSGDLDWSGRNTYYAFKDYEYMPNAIKMLFNNQTPEGYVWATCYPEDKTVKKSGEYGYYQSDLFSAWIVPTFADYLLFTDDKNAAIELYDKIIKSLNYLWEYVERDGLFFTRYETSKGLWDHNLSFIGKHTAFNIIICEAFFEGAFIAKTLGKNDEADVLVTKAETMKKGILTHLWDKEKGYFKKGLKMNDFCDQSNAMALAFGWVTKENANRLIENYNYWLRDNFSIGKVLSYYIRGCFDYGYDDLAIKMITGSTGSGKNTYGLDEMCVNWVDLIQDERGPACVTECMLKLPAAMGFNADAWGDKSHPDSGLAHVLSGYILGVQPIKAGFSEFSVVPHICNLTRASGVTPTPYGDIECRWEIVDKKFIMEINHPEDTLYSFIIPKGYEESSTIIVNGNKNNNIKQKKESDFYVRTRNF